MSHRLPKVHSMPLLPCLIVADTDDYGLLAVRARKSGRGMLQETRETWLAGELPKHAPNGRAYLLPVGPIETIIGATCEMRRCLSSGQPEPAVVAVDWHPRGELLVACRVCRARLTFSPMVLYT